MVIPICNVVALVEVAPANKHSVHSIRESTKYKCQVDSPAAHHSDKLNIGRVLLSGDSSQVGSAVRSPVTYETQDTWLEFKSCAHSSPPSLCLQRASKLVGQSADIRAGFGRRVDLVDNRFIGIVLQKDGRSRTYRVAKAIPFTKHGVDFSLLTL